MASFFCRRTPSQAPGRNALGAVLLVWFFKAERR
jgi:hypothetical protein